MAEISVTQIAPKEYQALVWDIFFASKARGIDLMTHFPWLTVQASDRWYVIAQHGDFVLGGLCVQEGAQWNSPVASVGLVCVHPAHRCRGISSELLNRALIEARCRGIAALRLWTNKPDVYRKHGFVVADISLYGSIEKPTNQKTAIISFSETLLWQDKQARTTIGLPPFARSGRQWKSDDASIISIEDESGTIIAEWAGAAVDVAVLLERVLPSSARLNAQLDDELINVLVERGWRCTLRPAELQMIAALTNERSPSEWAQVHTPRILHRI